MFYKLIFIRNYFFIFVYQVNHNKKVLKFLIVAIIITHECSIKSPFLCKVVKS